MKNETKNSSFGVAISTRLLYLATRIRTVADLYLFPSR